MTLPFAADRFMAHVVNGRSRVLVQGFDAKKHKVAEVTTSNDEAGIQTIAANSPGATILLFSGGENEGLLIDLCIFAKESDDGRHV